MMMAGIKSLNVASHRQFKHPTKPGRVTIAGHPSEEMDEGTRKSIFKQAGLKP
jgi:predicted RNA binding protein YcfA (HicA-like mRNA interferase family)